MSVASILLYFAQGNLTTSGTCDEKGITILPTWYQYLDRAPDRTGHCTLNVDLLNDIDLILLAVVEILLRLGIFVAIGFIIYGGIMFMTSQGEPEKAKNARHTIINALIGLAVALVATGIITFFAGVLQ